MRSCAECGTAVIRPRALRCDPCRETRQIVQARARQARYAALLPEVMTEAEWNEKRRIRARRLREQYRKANPPEVCVDCGEEVSGRNDSKRCVMCRPAWRRKLAAERQAAYRRRREG